MPYRALSTAVSTAVHRSLCIALACAPWAPASAAPLYLCKSFAGGGQFWSTQHCSKTNALVEKVVSVPDNIGFDQQVQAAERSVAQGPAAAAAVAATATRPGGAPSSLQPPLTAASASALAAKKAPSVECNALGAQLTQINVELRSAEGPEKQKPLLTRKHKALERRFELRCPN
jgi:hypothetical protein